MKRLFFNTFVSIVVGISASVVAADEHIISHNRGTRDTAFIDIASDTAVATFTARRSYSCIVLNREYDATIPKRFPVFNTTVIKPDDTTMTASAIGSMKPGVAVPANLIASQNNLRLSFIANLSGTYRFSFVDAQTGGTAVPGTTLRCNDTTLYGGFNRFFGNVVVVELTNETSEIIKPFITIIDTFGNVLVDNQFPSLLTADGGVKPDGRADIIFSDLPEKTYGQIIVTYVGSLGALSAYVAEYDFDGKVLTLKRERPMENTPALP